MWASVRGCERRRDKTARPFIYPAAGSFHQLHQPGGAPESRPQTDARLILLEKVFFFPLFSPHCSPIQRKWLFSRQRVDMTHSSSTAALPDFFFFFLLSFSLPSPRPPQPFKSSDFLSPRDPGSLSELSSCLPPQERLSLEEELRRKKPPLNTAALRGSQPEWPHTRAHAHVRACTWKKTFKSCSEGFLKAPAATGTHLDAEATEANALVM